jgi:alpha-1,2-mannosyltransferase
MSGSGPARNLAVAGAAAAVAVLAVYDLGVWIQTILADSFHNDLSFYYAAARLGLTHGWSGLYNLELQQEQLQAIGSQIRVAELARYISPPPLAWIVVPFTVLPFQWAYVLWSVVLMLALALTWLLASPGRGRSRVLYLVAAIGWLPVIYGLQLGQPGMLIALGVAACYALVQRDREVAAGAVLGVMVLKPQLAILVPAALLVTGRWRAFAAATAVVAMLVAISALALGGGGVAAYEQRLSFASTVPVNQAQTLAPWIGNLPVTRAIQVVIAVWALGLAYRLRARGAGLVIAVALVGGLAAGPYVHYDDLTMLGLAGWLYLRSSKQRWGWAYLLALAIAAEGFPIWGAGPVLIGELGALALLTLLPPPAASEDPAHLAGAEVRLRGAQSLP